MNWDRTGQIVRGIHRNRTFSGIVIGSQQAFNGEIVHTVELFTPLEVYGSRRIKINVEDRKILAAA